MIDRDRAIRYNKNRLTEEDIAELVAIVGAERLVELFQVDARLDADGMFGPGTAAALAKFKASLGIIPHGETADGLSPVIDRRPHAEHGRYAEHTRERDWSIITGITLHQTACVLGERAARWDSIGCHYGVTAAGKMIRLYDANKRIVHAHGFNDRTAGIEIDGRFEGIEGDISTLWDDPSTSRREQPTPLTDIQVLAARHVCRLLVAEVLAHGGEIKYIFAHRQASSSRRSDPGSEIWQRVAIPIMAELGLTCKPPGYQIHSGLPIPRAWDPDHTADY